MELLFCTNIVFVLITSCWPIWFSVQIVRLPHLNPINISFVVTVPVIISTLLLGPYFLIDEGLFDSGYQFSILMMSISNLFTAIGAYVAFKTSKSLCLERLLPFAGIKLTRRDLKRSEITLFTLFVIFFYLLASSEFGLVNWILDPRTGYQFYRTGQGHWYALGMSFLSAAFTCGVIKLNKPIDVVVKLLVYLPFCFLFGSKAYLLSFFIFTLILLWFMKWKSLKKFIAFGIPFIFLIMLFNFFGNSNEVILEDVFSYFDYYKNAADYYKGYLSGNIDLFYGQVLISSLWEYVPRGIFPEKPYIFGGVLVADIFYPGAAEASHTPAFGGAVMNFADFGVFGVIILSFMSSQALITGLGSYLVYTKKMFNPFDINLLTVLIVLMLYTPQFGMFFPSLLYIIILGIVLVVVKITRRR